MPLTLHDDRAISPIHLNDKDKKEKWKMVTLTNTPCRDELGWNIIASAKSASVVGMQKLDKWNKFFAVPFSENQLKIRTIDWLRCRVQVT